MTTWDRINRELDSEIRQRSGPSKKWMEEDLRRAVENTGKANGEKLPPPELVQKNPAPHASLPRAPVEPTKTISVSSKPAPTPAAPVDVRYVEPIKFKAKPNPVTAAPPKLRMADPTVLRIEAAYQRDALSKKSVNLIEKIIGGWDWANFKPPVCAQTDAGLFVIDGQHTAIAAASHPGIREIPILIVQADQVEHRAAAFVAHNRDRLALSVAQVFHGEVAAGIGYARVIAEVVGRAGASIPRHAVGRRDAPAGVVTAIGEVRNIFGAGGAPLLERIIKIAVASKLKPINLTLLRAIRYTLADETFAALPDSKIAGGLASIRDFEARATARGSSENKNRGWGGAQILAERLRAPR